MDLKIVLDDQMPSHTVLTTVSGSDMTVTVSPKVEAEALVPLAREIAESVADVIDQRAEGEEAP